MTLAEMIKALKSTGRPLEAIQEDGNIILGEDD